jgi:hypothetical protein
VTKAAEATRAGARETANRTEEAVRTGIEGVRRVTEEFSKTFGFTAQNPDLTRQAARGAGDYGGDWQGGRTFPSGGVAVTRATGVTWWRVLTMGNGWTVCGQRRSPILADHLVANWASSLELALAHFQTTFKFVADSVPVRDRPRPR